MAIEIKRTPVLKGDAASAFIRAVESNAKTTSEHRVRVAIEKSKKILSAFKKKS